MASIKSQHSLSAGGYDSVLLTASSIALRLLALISITLPHLVSPLVEGLGHPLFYGLFVLQSLLKPSVPACSPREVVTAVDKRKHRPRKRGLIEKQLLVQPIADQGPSSTFTHLLTGSSSQHFGVNALSIIVNSLLCLAALDHVWAPKLAFPETDLTYARSVSLSPDSSSLSLRFPGSPAGHVYFRPMGSSTWRTSDSIKLLPDDDWSGKVSLGGLLPGVQYEYRLHHNDITFPIDATLNFTTSPDPKLSRSIGSQFRFLHLGATSSERKGYAPWQYLPITATPRTPLRHRYRDSHLRQPGWRQLSAWLADMRERTAWSQVAFALMPIALESPQTQPVRQLLASGDTRGVYERLPLLTSRLQAASGSGRGEIEPGALTRPESSFSYGDIDFFRLKLPHAEVREPDSQDWELGVEELKRWLASCLGSFKIVLSPESLSPVLTTSSLREKWRNALLDVMAREPNVIILAEGRDAFTVSLLHDTVLEVVTPRLNAEPTPFLVDFAWNRNDGVHGRFSESGMEMTTLQPENRIIKQIIETAGARWTSIEVDTLATPPRISLTLWANGKSLWALDVIGRQKPETKAVGTIAESFQNLLRRFGLLR